MGRRAILWLAAHALIIAVLASGLPAEAWFVGDPGVKLIAARSALAHPARPFETDLPAVDTMQAADYPQPFFVVHGDHAHALTSLTFPVLTAPFFALFGLRGVYVLPAVGWLLTVPLSIRLSRRLATRAPADAIALCVIAATPLLFYGLEFWEHAPAVACVMGAACLVLGGEASLGAALLAGLLGALAIALRPEAGWSVLAIAVAARVDRGSYRWLLGMAVGLTAGLAPLLVYHVLHFGSVAGPHIAANAGLLTPNWLRTRIAYASAWLAPHTLWTVVALLMILTSLLLSRLTSERSRRTTQLVGVVGALIGAASVMLGAEPRENLWRVFPLALLALIPTSRTPARTILWILVAVPLIGVLLSTPNDGGGQWGPRYLVAIIPPLLILALDALGALSVDWGPRLAALVGACVLAAALVVSRSAYKELRAAKQFYGQIVATTARDAEGVRAVLTDVWWYPQVNAAVLEPQRALYVETPVKAAPMLQRWAPAPILLVRIGRPGSSRVEEWTAGTCYRPQSEHQIAEQDLVFTRLICDR